MKEELNINDAPPNTKKSKQSKGEVLGRQYTGQGIAGRGIAGRGITRRSITGWGIVYILAPTPLFPPLRMELESLASVPHYRIIPFWF